ncbi:hypothetical protein BLNAU_17197 [Blattamonas nauphoetae]|uniref:Uncharacterized protein n=1 Tax=Blattamonas nauphoetae TaxID=2049346 RepID=A0ABQ9X7Q6_9EUKA|nr:hypothetical protein BLNAU_17197 [Blattamonas nauphoetae]
MAFQSLFSKVEQNDLIRDRIWNMSETIYKRKENGAETAGRRRILLQLLEHEGFEDGIEQTLLHDNSTKDEQKGLNSESERMTTVDTKPSSATDSPCPDCFPFLNWNEEALESNKEKAAVLRSLVATVKSQSAPDDSLDDKIVKFLDYVSPQNFFSADALLGSFGPTTDLSSRDFVQSVVVLLSTPSQAITTAAMNMLNSFVLFNSATVRLGLVKADLIPQIINTLNPQSLSFAESVDIHIYLMKIIDFSFWLAAPLGLEDLEIEDRNEQLAVRETIFKQILLPSEKYICHLCVNRYSIDHEKLSERFLYLLSQLLQLCTYHKPTIDFVLLMPLSQRKETTTTHRSKSLRIADRDVFVLAHHQDSVHRTFLVGLVPNFCDKATMNRGIVDGA